jgi:hypothetical protein
MTWTDVSGSKIRVVQQKTRRKLVIPLHQAVREVLAAADRDHVTIINTASPTQSTASANGCEARSLRPDFRLIASLMDCGRPRGRRLAEAGCSANEIMSVLRHQTLAEAERYTRDASSQAHLATAAFEKLEGHKRNEVAQTNPRGLGSASKTQGES